MTEATGTTVEQVMAELAALEDPKTRAVNERHGDDHGVNLTKLRAVAKRLKTQQDLARELWRTGDTAARLLALLICRPRAFERAELDTMLREARTPKVQDWLVNYVVKKSPHSEELRLAWFADPDPVIASAGWALTTERVAKKPDGLDLPGLLDAIEAQMKDAPERLQWAMNHCLAQIGIEHPEHRARAIGIGERLEVLKDYPTPRTARPRSRPPGSARWCDGSRRSRRGPQRDFLTGAAASAALATSLAFCSQPPVWARPTRTIRLPWRTASSHVHSVSTVLQYAPSPNPRLFTRFPAAASVANSACWSFALAASPPPCLTSHRTIAIHLSEVSYQEHIVFASKSFAMWKSSWGSRPVSGMFRDASGQAGASV